MITALLSIIFLWCLLLGRIPIILLSVFCIFMGLCLALVGKHKHRQGIWIDSLALKSPLKQVNPLLKFIILITLLITAVTAKGAYTGIFLVLSMGILAILCGKLKLSQYVRMLLLPVSFVLIGGITLLFEISPEQIGVLGIPLFEYWICITETAQIRTTIVMAHAFGAVSCLCFFSMMTPMTDVIGVLHRLHCPSFMIDLMYLIYRYIFVLFSLHHEMVYAAKSRLGFRNYRASIRSVGKIYVNLWVRSYQFANHNFDAMESRCYDSGIRFLEHYPSVTAAQAGVCAVLVIISVSLNFVS